MTTEDIKRQIKWVSISNNYVTLPCLVLSLVMLIATTSSIWLLLAVFNLFIYLINKSTVRRYESMLHAAQELKRKIRVDELCGRG